MEQQRIDSLLERYLILVDEYSRLREELSKLQAGVYQNIARANFTGERGMRYGQDHYDERMRASRVLDVRPGENNVPGFTMKRLDAPADGLAGDDGGPREDEKGEDGLDGEKAGFVAAARENVADGIEGEQNPEGQEEDKDKHKDKNKDKEEAKTKTKTKKPSGNPLHWFGLLAPPPLRTAQTLSIRAVEQAIPRLVSVNAEMEHVEIEIRRARKRRAKAAAAAAEKEALGMEAVEAR
ncbi:hypothetical protein Trco_007720 [Trichoderma cornu-damae]|uniref:Vacuolar ATPase assembly protein VMA22 n=1 Tax=Trichoderma cornu-damae TaxID=654480 RepID=A0A9P8QGD4_9HYPO|nr:hypothetical protein Trco_007720 [Trichoderma cornu-damae]